MLPTLDSLSLPPDLLARINAMPSFQRTLVTAMLARHPEMVQRWTATHQNSTPMPDQTPVVNPFLPNARTGGGLSPTRQLPPAQIGGALPPTQTVPRAGGLLRGPSLPPPRMSNGNTGITGGLPPVSTGQNPTLPGQGPMAAARPTLPRAPSAPSVATPTATGPTGLPAPASNPTGRPALLRAPRLG